MFIKRSVTGENIRKHMLMFAILMTVAPSATLVIIYTLRYFGLDSSPDKDPTVFVPIALIGVFLLSLWGLGEFIRRRQTAKNFSK